MHLIPELEYVKDFINPHDSWQIYRQLHCEQAWPDNRYFYAGRHFILPRLQTWHADPGIRYSYSNNLLTTRAWTPLLLSLRAKVEAYAKSGFNAVLVNYYRDGQDYVGWHADDEAELGRQPVIASLTFGATRRFACKNKHTSANAHLNLSSGSLLIMQPAFQLNWLHSIPKAEGVIGGRINLTFRKVVM